VCNVWQYQHEQRILTGCIGHLLPSIGNFVQKIVINSSLVLDDAMVCTVLCCMQLESLVYSSLGCSSEYCWIHIFVPLWVTRGQHAYGIFIILYSYVSGSGVVLSIFEWPTGFLQCFDTVGWAIWPVKIVPDVTYIVSSGTLSLYSLTHSVNFLFKSLQILQSLLDFDQT